MSDFFGWCVKRISLVNWGGFVNNDFELSQDNILITAPNGTGKTAIFDAYSVCVGGGRSKDVDQSRDKHSRTVKGYVLGTFQDGSIRPNGAISYISVLFHKQKTTDMVAAILRIEAHPNDENVILNGMTVLDTDISTKNFLDVDNKPMDWDDFRDSMKIAKKPPETFSQSNYSLFRKHLMSVFAPSEQPIEFSHYQKLLTMMKNGVNKDFNPEEFIKNFVVDRNKIDLGDIREKIKDMQYNLDMNICFQQFSNQVVELKDIHEELKESIKTKSKLIKDIEHKKNVSLLKNLFSSKKEIESLQEQKDMQEKLFFNIESEIENLSALLITLENSESAHIIKNKTKEVNDIKHNIEQIETKRANVIKNIEYYNVILNALNLNYQDLTKDLMDSKQDELQGVLTSKNAEIQDRKKMLSEKERNINELQNNGKTLPKVGLDANKFSKMCAEKGIKVTPLYKLIDSVDEKYSLCIETFLNNRRFILIPGSYDDYESAKKLLSNNGLKIALPAKDKGCKPESMAEYIHTTDKDAKSYINYTLGNVMKMSGEDKENDNTLSVNIDSNGQIRRFLGRELSKLYPMPDYNFVLGQITEDTRKKRLSILIDEKEQMTQSLLILEQEYNNDKRVMNEFIKIDIGLPDIDNMKNELMALNEQYNDLKHELDVLKSNNDVHEKAVKIRHKKDNATLEKNKLKITIDNLMDKISRNKQNAETCHDEFMNNKLINSMNVTVDDAFMSEYYEQHKDISFLPSDMDAIESKIKKLSGRKRSSASEINIFCQKNNQYNNLQDIGIKIFNATNGHDDAYFEETLENIFNEENMKNRGISNDFAEQIPKWKDKLNDMVRDQYLKKVKDIMDNLNRNIKTVNSSIKNVELHNAIYQFSVFPKSERKKWIDSIEEIFGLNMISNDESPIVEQISNLIIKGDNDEILNPLNWYNYDIKVTSNGVTKSLEKWKGVGSGGMKAAPGYIALLGAMRNTVFFKKNEAGPLVLFIDEAMEAIDSETSSNIVDMYKQAGLQVVYLTNSSNFPSESVSQVIKMRQRQDKTVNVHNTYVHEPVKEMVKKTKSHQGSFL